MDVKSCQLRRLLSFASPPSRIKQVIDQKGLTTIYTKMSGSLITIIGERIEIAQFIGEYANPFKMTARKRSN